MHRVAARIARPPSSPTRIKERCLVVMSLRRTSPRVGLLWLTSRRPVRLLLAVFMLPIVLLANPTMAHAAGPWVPVNVSGIGLIPGLSCTFQLRQFAAGGTMLELSDGYCLGQPEYTPGWSQPGENGSGVSITVNGSAATGGSCTGGHSQTLGETSRWGTLRVAGSISSAIINTSAPDCSISEVCVSLGGANGSACSDVSIPSLEEEEPTGGNPCPAGTPHAYFTVERAAHPNGGGLLEDTVYVNSSIASDGPFTVTWGVAVQGAGGTGTTANGNLQTKTPVLTQTVTNSNTPLFQVPASAGIEVYAYHIADDWNRQPPDANAIVKPTAGTHPIPPVRRTPYFGWTDASHCRFYFGPQIIDDGNPATTGDVPFGTGLDPTPPGEEPPPVLPEPEPIVEPDTDLGWLALIWSMLSNIWETLKGFVSGIVNGVLNGLSGLFVPDRTIESRMSELDGVVDDRFPFNVAGSLTSMGLAPGGGIDGRAVADGSSSGTASSGVPAGGCPSWDVIVQGAGGESKTYDAVCDSSFTSAIRGARPIILAGLLAAAFWPLVRGLFFASVPIIKPVPTS